MNQASSPPTSVPAGTGADVWSATGNLLRLRSQWAPVMPGPRPAELPVAYAQERLWHLVQLDPSSPLYNIPLAWQLNGVLNLPALERALDILWRRHEALRLTFHEREGRPFARLGTSPAPGLRVEDLRSQPAAQREAEARRRAAAEICAPFDLSVRPLLRAVLYQLDEARHWLIVTVHQIIFDGWSLRVLSRELGAAYRGAALPPLAVQYVDFARWQREWLNDTTLEIPLGFWRKLLAEPCRPFALPWDRPEARADSGTADRIAFHLPRAQLVALKEICRADGTTPFMLLHATWTALLHRFSGQDDILVFASLASRTQSELQGTVGLLANVLPLRTRLPANPSFRDLLRASSEVVAGGLANQAAPFERILEWLRSAGGSSLFQALMIYQNAPASPPEGGELQFEWRSDIDNGRAKFDLLLDVANSPEGVRGTLKYRADRFDRATMEALLADWGALIEAVITAPDQPLAYFPLPRLGQRPIRELQPAPATSVEALVDDYRDGLELKLTAIWQKVLGVTHVSLVDSFFDLGGHSMRAVQLFTEIEKQLHRRLPIATLFRAPTLGQLANVLREEGCATQWPALVPIQPHGTKPPFIWLHTLGGGGGGGLLRYRALANLLGEDQPSFGIEAPHEPFTNIKAMATAYIEMLKTMQPHGPYYLGGYCFAANVAFEMACQLEDRGEKVAMLAVLESMPPEAMHRRTRVTPKNFGAFGHNLAYWLRDFFARPPRLVGADLLRLLEKIRPRKSVGPNFRELGEVLDLSEYPAAFRHYAEVHYRAMRQYQPGVYGGRITLFRSRTRPLFKFDPWLGWRPHVKGGIDLKIVRGKHESFLEEPLVRELAEEFCKALREAQAEKA